MFERRFTDRANEVMGLALDEVSRLKHEHVDPAHIQEPDEREGEGAAARALSASGVKPRHETGDPWRELARQ